MTGITVEQIIRNPTFDAEFAFCIARWDESITYWVNLYNSRETEDDPPADLMTKNVTFLTIVDDQLIIEVEE